MADKNFITMQRHASDPQKRRAEVEELMKQYGIDLNKYYLEDPCEFDYDKLSNSRHFESRHAQNIPMPFKMEEVIRLAKLPKHRINRIESIYENGKNGFGTFLLAREGDKFTLFSFSLVADSQENAKYTNFHVKLDICVGGKEWMPLIRYDSSGQKHPNYIVNNKVVKNESDVEFVRPPHIHVVDEYSQLYAANLSNNIQAFNAEHPMAKDLTLPIENNNPGFNSFLKELMFNNNFKSGNEIPLALIMQELDKERVSGEDANFKNVLNFMMTFCGVDSREIISEYADENWHYGKGQPALVDGSYIDPGNVIFADYENDSDSTL